jgi:mono/diheme cytochrome c family protein
MGRVRAATALLALVWIAAVDAGSKEPAHGYMVPEKLAGTGFDTLAKQSFSPQYPLWSDGASKARWIYLPPGSTIDTTDAGDWKFPVGTKFWKQFTFNGRKVETRFLWRASERDWVFATYTWSDEGTDALLAPDGGVPGAAELPNGKRHDIPGRNDCRTCHGDKRPGPLGFNALQLSTDRDPNAIHGEPLAPGMLTLATLEHDRRLSPSRPDLVANPPRIKTTDPQTRAVLGYFAANCGTCHNKSGEIAYGGPSLKHSDIGDGDAIATALLGQATLWQVPGQPEGASRMLNASAPDASAMLARMKSRRPSSQMPPLGTNMRDDEAIAAVTSWLEAPARRGRR